MANTLRREAFKELNADGWTPAVGMFVLIDPLIEPRIVTAVVRTVDLEAALVLLDVACCKARWFKLLEFDDIRPIPQRKALVPATRKRRRVVVKDKKTKRHTRKANRDSANLCRRPID